MNEQILFRKQDVGNRDDLTSVNECESMTDIKTESENISNHRELKEHMTDTELIMLIVKNCFFIIWSKLSLSIMENITLCFFGHLEDDQIFPLIISNALQNVFYSGVGYGVAFSSYFLNLKYYFKGLTYESGQTTNRAVILITIFFSLGILIPIFSRKFFEFICGSNANHVLIINIFMLHNYITMFFQIIISILKLFIYSHNTFFMPAMFDTITCIILFSGFKIFFGNEFYSDNALNIPITGSVINNTFNISNSNLLYFPLTYGAFLLKNKTMENVFHEDTYNYNNNILDNSNTTLGFNEVIINLMNNKINYNLYTRTKINELIINNNSFWPDDSTSKSLFKNLRHFNSSFSLFYRNDNIHNIKENYNSTNLLGDIYNKNNNYTYNLLDEYLQSDKNANKDEKIFITAAWILNCVFFLQVLIYLVYIYVYNPFPNSVKRITKASFTGLFKFLKFSLEFIIIFFFHNLICGQVNILFNNLIIEQSNEEVTGFQIAQKILGFLQNISLGFFLVMFKIAKKLRTKKYNGFLSRLTKLFLIFSFAIILSLVAVILIFARQISTIYTHEMNIQNSITWNIRIFTVSIIPYHIVSTFQAILLANKKKKILSYLYFGVSFTITLPLGYFLIKYFNLKIQGIFISFIVTEFFIAIICYIYVRKLRSYEEIDEEKYSIIS